MFPIELFFAATLSGLVLDPQGLPVAGARVELVCRDHALSVETDARGRFEIAAPSAGCRLSIRQLGFAPAHQPVGHETEWIIRLRVADVAEVVTVVPEPSVLSRRDPPGSVSLTDVDLKTIAGNTADLIRYASLLAGGGTRATAIYVDGLPSSVLPPIESIARISVNAGPFSAEHADGDVTFIQIVTKAPARTFRFNAGSDVLGLGGHSVIAPGSHAASRFGHVSLMGPVPHLPITFSARLSVGRTSMDVPIQAVLPLTDPHADTATSTSRVRSGALDVHYSPTSSLDGRISYRESRADASNLGVGGLVLPEAGFASSFRTREVRAAVTAVWSRGLYEGGVVVGQTHSAMIANAEGMGVAVIGDFVRGGAPSRAADTNRVQWTSKHVLRSRSSRPWSVGITLAGTDESNRQTPNPAGTLQFPDTDAYVNALAGGSTGTWFVTRGNGAVRYTNVTAAPFLQKTLVRSDHIELEGGLRADYQEGFGTTISPRISLAADWVGFNIRAGVGLFVRNLPANIFTATIANDGRHLQQFIATDVSLVNVVGAPLDRQTTVHARLASDLTRPRQLMKRISVERRLGSFISAVEYTWTEDNLLGSERLLEGAGWADVVKSNRAGQSRRLLTRISYRWKSHQAAASYERTHARDNTDGPFSFPEHPDRLAAEWARSAGASPHNFTAVGTFKLPGAVSLNVMGSWRSPAPFNITTGLDTLGNGLTLDRGGRARNSGDGPAYRSLAAYGYRRVQLPKMFGKSDRRTHLDLGVQVDNILDQRNYVSVGSIAGSPTFGKPLAAFPGRSLRVFLSLD